MLETDRGSQEPVPPSMLAEDQKQAAKSWDNGDRRCLSLQHRPTPFSLPPTPSCGIHRFGADRQLLILSLGL